MTFVSPDWLWVFAVLAALAAAYVFVQLRRRRYTVRFTNLALLDTVAPKRPGWRRHVTAVVFLAGTAALVLAMARPARSERVPRERATVIMAIDTSLSMEATDVAPNRLDAAQQAAVVFLDQLPPTINVGLVTFDGFARVAVPATTDRELIRRAIENLELGEGTAIGEAIFASLDALNQVPESPDSDEPAPGRIVLMSDGETTFGRPNTDASDAADEADVPVSTIAFGTASGFVVIEGQRVPVPVNEDALEEIADDTGGSFFTAATEEELAAV
ncbi:VWA domain-containing protein [soil metagenome]